MNTSLTQHGFSQPIELDIIALRIPNYLLIKCGSFGSIGTLVGKDRYLTKTNVDFVRVTCQFSARLLAAVAPI